MITTIERGGAEKQLLLLARSQRESNNEVTVVFLKGNPDLKSEFESYGVTVDATLSSVSWIRKYRLLCSYNFKDFDIFHAHLPISEILSSLTLSKNKLVVTRHNTEQLVRGKLKYFSQFLAILVETRAAACIAISNTVRDFMITEKEWRNPATISTIYYGYDKMLSSTPLNSSSQTNFLCISRLTPQKDITTLLKAFRIHLNTFSEDSLTIIGAGSEENRLREQIAQSDFKGKVRLSPKTENVSFAISSSDVFVLTSRYEGFGLVLLESMAIGRPILAAANSAVTEVMGFQFPGLFPVGDYILLANKMKQARDKVYQQDLVRYQNLNLNRFKMETVLRETQSIYERLIFQ